MKFARRRRARLAAALFSLALLATVPSQASGAILMTEDSAVFSNVPFSGMADTGYTTAGFMGASMIRFHRGYTPGGSTGPYFQMLDAFVSATTARGFQPYVTITYEPWSPPPTLDEMKSLCKQVADRYGSQVNHYSVWNEPNTPGAGTYLDAAVYNSIFRACRNEIKLENPAAKVYYGEIDAHRVNSCDYVTYSLDSSNPTRADGIAIHTYQWTHIPTSAPSTADFCQGIGKLTDWTQMVQYWRDNGQSLSQTNGTKVPLLITEHGYCDDHGECPQTAAGAGNRLSEAQRTDYIWRALRWANQNGVQVFSYYHLFNQPNDQPPGVYVWDTGIIERDGTPTESVFALHEESGSTFDYAWAPGGASVLKRSTGEWDLFIRGGDNALWHRIRYPNGTWSAWGSLGGSITYAPDVIERVPGTIDIYARGPDGILYQKSWWAANGWTGWISHGDAISSAPSVVQREPGTGRLELFARRADNSYQYKHYDPATGWTGWAPLGGGFKSAPEAVVRVPGEIDVFGRGNDDALWHKSFNPNTGTWSSWASHGGSVGSEPAAVSTVAGNLDVFVRSPDNRVRTIYYSPGAGWSNWASMGGNFNGPPAVGSPAAGVVELYVSGRNNTLWNRTFDPVTHWGFWRLQR